MGWMMLGMLAAGLLSLLYLGLIHAAAARARSRRRRGAAEHIAARIFAPHDAPSLGQELALLARWLRGAIDDQPRALPLLAAILAGGMLLILALDPILDDPFLWQPGLELPGWAKGVWAGLVLLLVVGHAVWIGLNAPKHLSRHWLVLHPDGAITALGADLPRFDPSRPIRHFEGITMPAQRVDGMEIPERWAEGAVLAQGDVVAGFVYHRTRQGPAIRAR